MIKAKIKELLRKLTSSFVTVHTTTVTIASASYVANARASVVYNNAVPEDAIVLGIIVNAAPNLDWFRTMAYMNGRQLVIRYHNEYTGTLTGQFGAVITYAIVGGVLRNLSIFKAFRHFMSLQKGGGVDGQTGYKGITLQGSRKADQHRYGIHRKLDRVLIFCEPSTSDADTHTAGRNVLIAGSYTADEHCVIISELQYKSSAIQGSDRSRLFPYGGNSHRASRRIPAKLGINISDVFILGKGFNNRYPNCIAFSERRCAA